MYALRLCLVCSLVLLLGGLAFAQNYEPVPILLDDDPNPDGLGIVENVDYLSVNATGMLTFTGDDEVVTTTDDFLYVNGNTILREGDLILGTTVGATVTLFDTMYSYRHIDAVGNVTYTCNLGGTAPTTADDAVCINNTALMVQGDAAPGIAGSTINFLYYPSISDAGDIFFEVSTLPSGTSDEAIYYIPSGGVATIMPMNAVSKFREGQLIIGGVLDGEYWDSASAFYNETANALGTFIVEGEIEPANDVIVRKQIGLDYEVLLEEGDVVTVPLPTPGTAGVVESVTEVCIASGNNNWAMYGYLTDASVGGNTLMDYVVLADVGAGVEYVVQESQDISALTGYAGTYISSIYGIDVNTSGKVLVHCFIGDTGAPVAPPFDEAIFLWDAGVLELAMTDQIPVAALPGFLLTDIGSYPRLNDQNRIFFEGTGTDTVSRDGIFEAVQPNVLPVQSLLCTVLTGGTEVIADWQLQAGQTYTEIRVYFNGTLQPALAGTATTWTSPIITQTGLQEVCVIGFDGVEESSQRCCTASFVLPPDYTECRTPIPSPEISSLLPDVVDVLPMVTNVAIQNVSVYVKLTHTFLADLEMSVTSPLGTMVELMWDDGSSNDDCESTFADFGVLAGTGDYNSNLVVLPAGPGAFSDMDCESSGGDWTLTIHDDAGGDTGLLDTWCVNIYEELNPGLDCCAKPGDLVCTPLPGGNIDLTWVNNDIYFSLELARTDSLGGMVTIPLAATATSYTDLTAASNDTYDYALNYVCGAGGTLQLAAECQVLNYAPDYVECSTPVPPPAIDSTLPPVLDVLPVVANVAINTISVYVDITHTWRGDLEIDVASPLGTTVRLMDNIGSSADNVDSTFADFGIPITGADLAAGLTVQPQGPGVMADFRCENSGGNWTLWVDDTVGGDTGVLNEWCLEIYEEANPGADCCARPSAFGCSNVGACGGPAVSMAWNNNHPYLSLVLVRDTGGTPLAIPLSPTATSYTDTTVVAGTSYGYTLNYVCAAGGTEQEAASCTVAVDVTSVAPVTDMTCVADTCGTGYMEVTWNTNGVSYDLVELYRAGVFLADVTVLSSYTDTTPNPGASTYSIIASCGVTTAQTNCVADNTPPAIVGLVCVADFCLDEATIVWSNTSGVPYTSVELLRGGVFLADVTGLGTYIDSPLTGGTFTYSIIGYCGTAASPPVSCSVNNVLTMPDDFVCSAAIGSDIVELAWTNPISYTTIELLRDGVLVSPQPLVGDSFYTDSGLASGGYTYTLILGCAGGFDQVECTVGVASGSEFLFCATDADDGVVICEPNSGVYLQRVILENATGLGGSEFNVAQCAVVGPNGADPTGEPLIYVSDDLNSYASIRSYTLGGLPLEGVGAGIGYVLNTEYDEVRGLEFRGNVLYFACGSGSTGLYNRVSSIDVVTEVFTDYIIGPDATDLLFLDDGRVLVTDDTLDEVLLYDAAGANPLVLVGATNAPGFSGPTQLAARGNGNFIVGSWTSDEVIEFTLTGTVVNRWTITAPSSTTGATMNVEGVHELPSGEILIGASTPTADEGIWSFDPSVSPIVLTHVVDELFDVFYMERYPDDGGPQPDVFVRGNVNNDGSVNIADAVYLLGNLFPGGNPPNEIFCSDAADANDDGNLNIADAVALLGSLFGSPTVPLPAPIGTCGADPTDADALDCADYNETGGCP